VFVYEWCLVFDLKININIELIKNTELQNLQFSLQLLPRRNSS